MGEPFWRASKELNNSLVKKRKVRLELDHGEIGRSPRMLAYVYVGDVFVNAEMVKRGYARVYGVEPDTRHAKLFRSLEEEARKNRRGIWKFAEEGAAELRNNQAPAEDEYNYVASKSSKVFHLLSCLMAERIAESNKIFFHTFKEAVDSGRRPCKVCDPKDAEVDK